VPTKPADIVAPAAEQADSARQIKSRDRVRDLAEVFTAEREVNAMLDLVKDVSYDPKSRFLEPACGNGNFLVEILSRKLKRVREGVTKRSSQADFEFSTLIALSSIYGIDISDENTEEAKARLKALIVGHYSSGRNTWRPREGFYSSVDHILDTNIILGDSLNGAEKIVFVEYSAPARHRFAQVHYRLSDLEFAAQFAGRAKPVRIVGARKYWELGE
jgi:hypothetical protein